ncbi:MAG: NCS2 family permease [Eubacterium sp.]|nr:NCS2 family permease [Eubacterium sp.]
MEKFFKLKENGTSVKIEILAGITTFVTMAYIIMVNPAILSTPFEGTDMHEPIFNGVFFATCIAAFIGTLLMGVLAKLPFAQAPGMGMNAFFTYSVMLGMGYSYQAALAMVLISGALFVIITLCSFREQVVMAIPKNIKVAISVGIGLFLAFIGFQDAGIVVLNQDTMVSMVDFSTFAENPTACWGAVLAFLGIVLTTVLYKKNITGSILISIIVITILGIFTGNTVFEGFSIDFGNQFKDFTDVSLFACFDGFKELFQGSSLGKAILTLIMLIITFSMVDMFDTLGTLIGTAKAANMLDEDGNIPNGKKSLLCDALATVGGAICGTSTVTTYGECISGISVGGKTGLTSVVTAILFLVSIIFAPFVGIIPACATAPALIFIGGLLLSAIKEMEFDDVTDAIPAYLAMFTMPLTYSIANGIAIGLISYTLIKIFTGKIKEVHILTIILSALFVLRYFMISL